MERQLISFQGKSPFSDGLSADELRIHDDQTAIFNIHCIGDQIGIEDIARHVSKIFFKSPSDNGTPK